MVERQEWLNALFQFTPLREGRHVLTLTLPITHTFQFTPLREGRHNCQTQRAMDMDFNSRPSARGDLQKISKKCDLALISIHAPPRGATVWIVRLPGCSIFQFTPLREGRR